MAGYSFTPLAPRPGIQDPFAKPKKPQGILAPPTARNPFWSQAAGKPWDPASQVQTGPVRYTGPKPTTLPPGLAPGTTTAGHAPQPSVNSNSSSPPIDATAASNIATHTFNTNNQINADQAQITNLGTNLANALAALAYQQPRDELGLEQGANARGALYSTAYNQNLGDLIHKYATQQNNLTTTEGQNVGALNAAISALQGSIPLYNNNQYALAAGRLIQQAQNNPATGQPTSAPAGNQISDAGPWQPTTGHLSVPNSQLSGAGPWKPVSGHLKIPKPPKHTGFGSTVKKVK